MRSMENNWIGNHYHYETNVKHEGTEMLTVE